MARGIGLLVCRLRTTLISLVVPVRLAACIEESSVLKRLPEPLLFRIQYRMARVALSEPFVAFAVDLDPVFLLPRFGERRYRCLESSQNNT